MTLRVEQGRTIRLPADFFSGDAPCDPADPRLHILNPSNDPVATWVVPHRQRAGVYYFDFEVAPDAPIGSWTARWTGTINGELVGGDDRFDVLQPNVIETAVSTRSPAKGHQRGSSARAETRSEFLDEGLGRLWSSSPAEFAQAPAAERKWPATARGKARQKKARQGVKTDRRQQLPRPRLRTKVLVAVLLLILVGAVVYVEAAEKAMVQQSFDLADKAFRAGRFDEAQIQYFSVLEKDPTNKFAHFNLGILAQRENRLTEAQYQYGRALAKDPDFTPALYNQASVLEATGRSAQAADAYRRLLKTSPDHAASHFNLGLLLYMKLGDPVEGRKEISEALKLDPGLTSKLDANLAVQIPPPNQPSP